MPTQAQLVEASAPPSSSPPHALSEPASLLLDLIRFSAAILVVIAHLGHVEFNTGFPNHQILGDIAVPIFFVLSGFVIRFVTRSREHTARDYFIDRASRMYSVILPAMALTIALAAIVHTLNPAFYQQYFAAFSDHPLTRVLLNLTFLSQSWSHSTIPLINSPFWSLSYECLYYLAYGLFFYLRGARRMLALTLWAIIAGPQVLFLLPIWCLGAVVYDLYRALRTTRAATILRNTTLVYLVLAVIPFTLVHRALVTTPLRACAAFTTLPNPLALLHLAPYRASMMALGTGILASAVMLLLLLLADTVPLQRRNVWVRRFRHLADGTFAIYLMHYPMMVLATALGLFRPGRPILTISVTTAICLVLIYSARHLDLLKVAMRSALRRLPATHPKKPPQSERLPQSAGALTQK